MYRTLDDLPQRIQDAVRGAMPSGAADFSSFINSPWPVLGNRSLVQTLNEDGFASESAIINACEALKQLRTQGASRVVL